MNVTRVLLNSKSPDFQTGSAMFVLYTLGHETVSIGFHVHFYSIITGFGRGILDNSLTAAGSPEANWGTSEAYVCVCQNSFPNDGIL